ncbi:hypothetical protein N658DRAFT_519409 [Parathielavia hyrcaniae]|uniref:Uncharacterized protein n=1 Tax=Parathielavia hyrcaniae TaxID=113614 RepID=A0AAN6PQY0_9PEZI|nr:hypothetical protein N658DRAFT_519409 [Parathielavia hyrcaniae]
MAKKTKKSPPRVYHDGLIPTATDTYQSYPEVVPDDHDQVKHEKSYPELAPQQQPDPTKALSSSHSPPTSTSTAPGAQHHHHHHHPQSAGDSAAAATRSPLAPPSLIHPVLSGLPRTSGVHSLRQAWSDVDESDDGRGRATGGASRRGARSWPLLHVWKTPVFWVAAGALVVIAVLAGVLGAVTSPPSVTDPSCPGTHNLNYTSASSTPQRTFRIQCGANYPGGDGALGLLNGTDVTDNMDVAACLNAFARQAGCVGAVFGPGTVAGACWLKEFIGVVRTGGDVEGMVSGVLWQ